MPLPLAALLADLPGLRRTFGDLSGLLVSDVQLDSRRVLRGSVFVVAPGRHEHDDHVPEALARGATAVVVPAGREPPPGVPGAEVEDPRAAFSRLAAAIHGRPSERLRVVGVTGTNGKTTVAAMTAQALGAGGLRVAHWTTDGVWSGRRRFRPVFTTPEASDLHRFLQEAADAGCTEACIEVSSHAVVARRVADVRFAAGAVTGVTPDHIDFHGSFEAYLEAKAAFLRSLPPGAPCLFNRDDDGACRAAAGIAAEAVSYGFHADADLRGTDPDVRPDGAACTVEAGARLRGLWPAAAALPGPVRLELPITGRHNLQNGLCALGLALALGVPGEAALGALRQLRPPARRLAMRRIGPYTLVDDVAMNEASFDAVLAAVAATGAVGVVAVVALRGNRGEEIQARIARTLARWQPHLRFGPLLVSLSHTALAEYDLDHRVRPEEVTAFTAAAGSGGLACEVFEELDAAVDAALVRLRPGGTLLLLGTFGMDRGLALAERRLGVEAPPDHPPPVLG